MTRAAIYEKLWRRRFKISSYYKKDYSSLNTWVTLIWITVGYGLAVAVLFLGWGEAAMEGITLAKLFVCRGGDRRLCVAADSIWNRCGKLL